MARGSLDLSRPRHRDARRDRRALAALAGALVAWLASAAGSPARARAAPPPAPRAVAPTPGATSPAGWMRPRAAAARKPARLPPLGPPPDPRRGDAYDGRARRGEADGRRVALAAPRLALAPTRLLLRLARAPLLAGAQVLSAEQSVPLEGAPSARGGVTPVVWADLDNPPVAGARLWTLDLWGPGIAETSVLIVTGGPRYVGGRFVVSPSRARLVGLGLDLSAFRRADLPFYGLAGEVPAGASADELRRRVGIGAIDARASLALRPGGRGGRWRATIWGGGGLRAFDPGRGGPSVTAAEAPGFEEGATLVRGGLSVERVGGFDASRRRPALDVALALEPTLGVLDDESRAVTATVGSALGLAVGGGATVLVRALVADQESWGADPVTFHDRLSLGGTLHRGFDYHRFRGGSAALVALDYRWPIGVSLDGFAFVDHGGVFGERFSAFEAAALRTSVGMGVRVFWRHGFLLRALVGFGIGDGARFSIAFDPGP